MALMSADVVDPLLEHRLQQLSKQLGMAEEIELDDEPAPARHARTLPRVPQGDPDS
jgi:hypothetical protein